MKLPTYVFLRMLREVVYYLSAPLWFPFVVVAVIGYTVFQLAADWYQTVRNDWERRS